MPNKIQNTTYNCPICHSSVNKPKESYVERIGGFQKNYNCPRCGDYWIEDILESFLPSIIKNDIQKIAVLSHWVRTQYEIISKIPPDKNHFRKHVLLNEQLVNSIIKNPPPTPAQQADNFVLWLGKGKNPRGEFVWVQATTHQSIMGSITPPEFGLVLEHLIKTEILDKDNPQPVEPTMHLGANVRLSFKGWQYFEKLKKGESDSLKAFMAMEYGDPKLDGIVENIFKPAVKQTGFDLFLLYYKPKAGLLDDQLRVEIQTSRFLIADLSHNNSGSYWEAGYAEGLGKPVIYTCDQKVFDNPETKPHFDTNHHLTIKWDETKPEEAAEKLKATIRATLPEAAKLTDD